MKIFESLDDIKQIDETVVALGNFDGVHMGHQQIITRTVRSAKAVGLSSAVFTFSNHPSTILGKGEPVKNILYAEEKNRIIEEMGVDYVNLECDLEDFLENLNMGIKSPDGLAIAMAMAFALEDAARCYVREEKIEEIKEEETTDKSETFEKDM